MEALEFKSKIKNDKIQIPNHVKSKLVFNQNKNVRVIVLLEDSDDVEEKEFKNMASETFFEGYSHSDSVYDDD
ncbi:hypothetical protein [Flavobacterium sp. CS20]|uniref:hypothetical protein n=1 Tax=Flavobacterium sp. CS20 TaxID=2775246 RepID=UPI001B3A6F52|nr:hypothetical protein [Flavobacterium sp. CS20]QTY25992.1 hypothetical protein IGB25_08205 [Flavobacterium sp. CS20]